MARRAEAEKRRLLDAELRDALSEVARKTADTSRWLLIQHFGRPGEPGYLQSRDQQLRRAAVLLDDVEAARRRLWLALGMPDPAEPTGPALTSEEKRVLLQLRQTMRLQACALPPAERAQLIAEKQAEELVPVEPMGDAE
jgi:hypothetical protein